MARFNPLVARQIAALVIIICSAVVLGISAHVENAVRVVGLKTSFYTYDAFMGAFTIVVELGLAIARQFTTTIANSLIVETGVSALLWIMWLAAAAATTIHTEQDRSVCKDVDGVFADIPGGDELDQAAIAILKKAMKQACREIRASIAFLWMLWIGLLLMTIILTAIGLRKSNRVGKQGWKAHIRDAQPHTANPFADPEGNAPGPSVGVVNEDPDWK